MRKQMYKNSEYAQILHRARNPEDQLDDYVTGSGAARRTDVSKTIEDAFSGRPSILYTYVLIKSDCFHVLIKEIFNESINFC